MGRNDADVGDDILLLGCYSFNSLSSPALTMVRFAFNSLDVTRLGNGENHVFFRNEIFFGKLADFTLEDFRSPLVAVGLFDFD